ncbi:hypothetical protein PS15m_010427 [Mucor circinelloides]
MQFGFLSQHVDFDKDSFAHHRLPTTNRFFCHPDRYMMHNNRSDPYYIYCQMNVLSMIPIDTVHSQVVIPLFALLLSFTDPSPIKDDIKWLAVLCKSSRLD